MDGMATPRSKSAGGPQFGTVGGCPRII